MTQQTIEALARARSTALATAERAAEESAEFWRESLEVPGRVSAERPLHQVRLLGRDAVDHATEHGIPVQMAAIPGFPGESHPGGEMCTTDDAMEIEDVMEMDPALLWVDAPGLCELCASGVSMDHGPYPEAEREVWQHHALGGRACRLVAVCSHCLSAGAEDRRATGCAACEQAPAREED